MFRRFSHANRTPEIQMIVRFLKVFASCGEELRVGRHHDAVQPAREEKQECKADVSCEKSLKNPECMRFEDVSQNSKGQSETSCDLVVSSLR